MMNVKVLSLFQRSRSRLLAVLMMPPLSFRTVGISGTMGMSGTVVTLAATIVDMSTPPRRAYGLL
jgi:hypothetical protein